MKLKQNIIESDYIFQIIHTKILIIGGSGSGETNALSARY